MDFVPAALEKARAKARVDNVDVNFVHADVRHLRQAGITGPLQLIVDNGCLHNMNDDDRDSYVREVSAVAAPDARLLIVAFIPGGRFGVRGIDRSRDGTAFRIRLDIGVRRRRAGARPREDPDAVLPLPARRLGQRDCQPISFNNDRRGIRWGNGFSTVIVPDPLRDRAYTVGRSSAVADAARTRRGIRQALAGIRTRRRMRHRRHVDLSRPTRMARHRR